VAVADVVQCHRLIADKFTRHEAKNS